MLKNAYLDAKFRLDTDENEPKKESCVVANERSDLDVVDVRLRRAEATELGDRRACSFFRILI